MKRKNEIIFASLCLAMINAQLLSELEEVWHYKILPERRQSIREIWQKRMQGNQPIIDDYHRLLLTHSLCLPMAQDLQSWLKLANLCRKSNRLTMADFIFKQLTQTVLTDQTNLNRDMSVISSNTFHTSSSHHLNVQTSTTPTFSIQSQQAYCHPSLIDQQLVKYEKAKYEWHCLAAVRERLLVDKQSREQASKNEKTQPNDTNHDNKSTSPSSLQDEPQKSNLILENTNNKIEQNRQEQLKIIEDMKELVTKTCLPALDHLRRPTTTATTSGNVQQQNMMTPSGGTTGAILVGATQNINTMPQLPVRFYLNSLFLMKYNDYSFLLFYTLCSVTFGNNYNSNTTIKFDSIFANDSNKFTIINSNC